MKLMHRQPGSTATGVVSRTALQPLLVSRSGLLSVFGCVVGVAVAAQVRIPVPGTDVPLTLQSLAVLLCGYWLAPRLVVAGLLAYLALGAAGMPVFSPGSAGLAGGTGGYLVGFVVGAWLVSRLKGDVRASVLRLLMAGTAGTLAIFGCGLIWRFVFFGGDATFAVMTGLVPFAAKAVVQLGVAVSLVLAVRGLPGRHAGRRRV